MKKILLCFGIWMIINLFSMLVLGVKTSKEIGASINTITIPLSILLTFVIYHYKQKKEEEDMELTEEEKNFGQMTQVGCFSIIFLTVLSVIIGYREGGFELSWLLFVVWGVLGCIYLNIVSKKILSINEKINKEKQLEIEEQKSIQMNMDKSEEPKKDITNKDKMTDERNDYNTYNNNDNDDNDELYDDEVFDEEYWDDGDSLADDDSYDSFYGEFDQIESDEVYVSQRKFEAVRDVMQSTYEFVENICNERAFQDYIGNVKSGNDRTDTASALFSSIKFFIMKDILRSYDKLGHSYSFYGMKGRKIYELKMDEPEGQYLHEIIALMMAFDSADEVEYDEYRKELRGKKGRYKELRAVREQALETYAEAGVNSSASNGLDDFQLCLVLHNYNKEYEQKYRVMMYRIASLIAKVDDTVTEDESLYLSSIMNPFEDVSPDHDNTLKETPIPYESLDEMVGLGEVKQSIHTLSNFIKVNQKREELGMKVPNVSYHCVFSGNPGTGKTTVARILAGIYKDLGVLKKGHLVETDRSGLVAEYVGQTAVKTNKIIDEALDGVLFIDEAYSLVQEAKEDYGKEAIATLLKRMEDDRERLVVILAGYTNEIEDFINSNPGLRSRFNRYIYFADYTAEELYEIFCMMMKKNEFSMTEENCNLLKKYFEDVVNNKPKDFGNARFVRNLFERTVQNQANRLAKEGNLTRDMLKEIKVEDWNG